MEILQCIKPIIIVIVIWIIIAKTLAAITSSPAEGTDEEVNHAGHIFLAPVLILFYVLTLGQMKVAKKINKNASEDVDDYL